MKSTTTRVAASMLIVVAILMTMWTAASLQPAESMLGARPAALSWATAMDQASDAASEQDVRYEQISERSLLMQLMRSFLASPWLEPDLGVSRQARVPPPQGWAFPVLNEKAEEGEAVEKDADEEEEGVFLSRSSSALLTKRLERLGARTTSSSSSSSSGSPWQDVEDPLMQASAHDPYDPSDNAIDDSSDSTAVSDRGASQSDASNAADVTNSDGGGLDAAQAAEAEQLAAAAAAAEESAAVQAEQAASDPQASASVAAKASLVVAFQYLGPLHGESDEEEATEDEANGGHRGGGSSSSEDGGSSGGKRGGSGRHLYLALCSTISDWLCVRAISSRRKSAAFELLPMLTGSLRHAPKLGVVSSFRNGSVVSGGGGSSSNRSAADDAGGSSGTDGGALLGLVGVSSGAGAAGLRLRCALGVTTDGWCKDGMSDWFALRSRRNGKLVQVAPRGDDEAWVVRARGEGARPPPSSGDDGSGWLAVGSLELWRAESVGLRNLGTGALINFRGGVADGDGVSVRAHGDTAPRKAALLPTSRTRFALRRANGASHRLVLDAGAGAARAPRPSS